MINTINCDQQVLLFLNRRGYAPLMLCTCCGYRFICTNCSSWLVEHKIKKRLECHHCGYIKAIPKICPACHKQENIISFGPGVERIAEEVKSFLPEAKIVLLTRDTIKHELDVMYQQILLNQVNVIIGTQLIAKGHHFPFLALVGVIDADMSLTGGDLRSAEKTFQLLQQVGGRAGRDNIIGKAILQTYYPDNDIIKAIALNDKEGFYAQEISSRKDSEMPPFSRLCSIIISGANTAKVEQFAYYLVKTAPTSNAVTIWGPVKSFIHKIKRKHRYRILVKAPKNYNVQSYISNWLNKINVPSFIKLKIDIDPYNFL